MRQTLTTFILGVIVGVGIVVATGYAAGFQRPAPTVLPQAAVVQPSLRYGGWDDYAASERNIPKDLQECVAGLQGQIYQREIKFALEKALGTCLARQKPSKAVAQK